MGRGSQVVQRKDTFRLLISEFDIIPTDRSSPFMQKMEEDWRLLEEEMKHSLFMDSYRYGALSRPVKHSQWKIYYWRIRAYFSDLWKALKGQAPVGDDYDY